jgi:mono-ADP-ribosyltransferase sirtuin 6
MSSGYASRLSEYPNKGECGLPELSDSRRAVVVKLKTFVSLVKNAKQVVVITGAGISTSAGIPDFRGPKGVWTKEQEEAEPKSPNGKKRKRHESGGTASYPRELESFIDAKPTICHRAITKLVTEGIVSFCESTIKIMAASVYGHLFKRSNFIEDAHSLNESIHFIVWSSCFYF